MYNDLNLKTVNWLDIDISDWKETSKLELVFNKNNTISFKFADAGKWPTVEMVHYTNSENNHCTYIPDGTVLQVDANCWVFVFKDNRWHAGTWGSFFHNSYTKPFVNLGGHRIKQDPLTDWYPVVGETLYFMVSAYARFGENINVKERTNAVKVQWPALL